MNTACVEITRLRSLIVRLRGAQDAVNRSVDDQIGQLQAEIARLTNRQAAGLTTED